MQKFFMSRLTKRVTGMAVVLCGLVYTNNAGAQKIAGDNLGNHKATIALDLNAKNMNNIGSTLYGVMAVGDLPAGGVIGTAAATVDIFSTFTVNQTTTAGLTLTLPAPTVTTAGRVARVMNIGTRSFLLYGVTLAPGQQATFLYGGIAPGWIAQAALPVSSLPLSSISAAVTTNAIDNLSFAQTWNWSTATTQNPFLYNAAALTTGSLATFSADALTTGSVLRVTSNSALNTGANGLLYVANTNAATTGTVARIQANASAGSGLTVLANGRVGIGNLATGTAALQVTGDVTSNNLTATGNIVATGNVIATNVSATGAIAGATVSSTGNMTAGGDMAATRYLTTMPAAIASATTTTINMATGNVFTINVGASITTLTLNNAPARPATFVFKLVYSSNTAYTITWPTSFKWAGGTAPTLTSTTGKVDIISIIYDGSTYYASYGLNY